MLVENTFASFPALYWLLNQRYIARTDQYYNSNFRVSADQQHRNGTEFAFLADLKDMDVIGILQENLQISIEFEKI